LRIREIEAGERQLLGIIQRDRNGSLSEHKASQEEQRDSSTTESYRLGARGCVLPALASNTRDEIYCMQASNPYSMIGCGLDGMLCAPCAYL
jgi:hypothetical protein